MTDELWVAASIHLATYLQGLGAFMAGVASLVTALYSVRVTKRRMRSECDRRIKELQRAYRSGMKLADSRPLKHDDDLGERWSHLE